MPNNHIQKVNVSREERRFILDKIGKYCAYKNTTGEDVVKFVDQIANGLKMM